MTDRNYSETPNSSPDDLLGTVKASLDAAVAVLGLGLCAAGKGAR